MARPRASLAWIAACWDRMRRRYFLDAEDPLKVPPLAKEITIYWLPPESPYLGLTEFDEDEDAESLGVSPLVYYSQTHARALILHELTHARDHRIGGKSDSGCMGKGKAWRKETLRLAALGAPLL